jgi:hypothetical protein
MSATLIQVHLGEKTKFFAQRFARSSGLTLGAFVENCVSTVLSLTEMTTGGRTFTFDVLEKLLWSEHAADRFVHVAAHFPALLTERERVLWRHVICKSPEFWKVSLNRTTPSPDEHTFNSDMLRSRWDEFEAMSREDFLALANTIKHEAEAARVAALPPEGASFREKLRITFAQKQKEQDEKFEQEMVAVREANQKASELNA